MDIGYLPLRVRSSFSTGASSIGEIFNSMKEFSYIPIADFEGIWGWGRLKIECIKEKEKRVKPVYGAEISFNGDKLLLFVKDKKGYYNLCKLINRKDSEGKGLVAIYIPSSSDLKKVPEDFDDLYIGITLWNLKWLDNFKKIGLPLVWANPVNFFKNPTQYSLILSIKKGFPFPRLKNKNLIYYSPLSRDFLRKFTREESIFDRTWEVAEKCDFDLKGLIPNFKEKEHDLRKIVKEKIGGMKLGSIYIERIEKELRMIEELGFSSLFLLTYDITMFAREKGILYNLRGSGASSLVAYILGISHVDPIKAGLYFERFMNKGRDSLPDLDIDFESGRRDEVINYVFKKYFQRASFIAEFKDFKARSAVYYTCKALGLSPSECREITKKVPFFEEPSILEKIPPPTGAETVWKLAPLLEGIHFQKSIHIGGIIFTPFPVTSYLPIENSSRGYPVTQFDKEIVEEIGIAKIDLLGVRGLSTISETIKNVKINKIPENDSETFDLIGRGDTIGCFQIESPAMIDLLKKIKPKSISELADALALIRPGPTESGMKKKVVMIRNSKESDINPFLKRLLPESNGIIIYEEQIMEIANRIGFEWDEAEILRRSLKKGEEENLKSKFFERGRERGLEEKEIEEIWQILKYFSSYTFNKAHAFSYAWSAYISAFLKTHYPLQFFSSLINSGGGYYPQWEYIEEARRKGIKILPPDVCKSDEGFKVEGNALRKGLLFIKGIRKKTLKRIIEEREKKNFSSLQDFIFRVKPGKEEIFSLIDSCALDSLSPLSSQISLYLGTLGDVKIIKDSRRVEESLGEILGKFSREFPYKIKNIPLTEGREISIPVRIVDVRIKRINGENFVFYLFEDETGLLEGNSRDLKIPETRLVIVRGEISLKDGNPKLTNCKFTPIK